MPYPLTKIGNLVRHRLRACKTRIRRVSFTKKAGCHRTIGNLQSDDCGKMTLEKAQGKLRKMEIRRHDVLIHRAPLPLLAILRPPPEF
ncbi:hypothetical protein [Nitrosospira multiformis]|uniref:hypothetical protein n=1 Tax=Nitrosospira multiformis TaxID=1231 RepID=UPI000898DAEB|nr:hypothetical protein [Nitrosospira multiformis]SDZ96173.1 hypothetical protein SAMN05216411_103117 [Nitrosospira multiformis]